MRNYYKIRCRRTIDQKWSRCMGRLVHPLHVSNEVAVFETLTEIKSSMHRPNALHNSCCSSDSVVVAKSGLINVWACRTHGENEISKHLVGTLQKRLKLRWENKIKIYNTKYSVTKGT